MLHVATSADTPSFTIRSSAGWYKTNCVAPGQCDFPYDKLFEYRMINNSPYYCGTGTLLEEKETSGLSEWVATPLKGSKVLYSPWQDFVSTGRANFFLADLLDASGYFTQIRVCKARSVDMAVWNEDTKTCDVSDKYQTSTDCPSSCLHKINKYDCTLNMTDEKCQDDERCIPAASKYKPHALDGVGLLEVQGECVAGSTGNVSLVKCNASDALQQWTFTPTESLV